MKKLCTLSILLACCAALAQSPIVRNPITTASADTVTNIIRSASGLTLVAGETGIGLSNAVTGYIVWLIPDASLGASTNVSLPSALHYAADGGSSASPTNNDTRNFSMAGTWSFPGGVRQEINTTTSTTNETAVAVWTNSVTYSNSLALRFWGAGSGATNKVFVDGHALFWREGGDLELVATNQVLLGSNACSIYAAAENGSNAVLYVQGFTNENMGWHVDGFSRLQTNGWANAGEPVPGASCTNIWGYGGETLVGNYVSFNTTNENYWATKYGGSSSAGTICRARVALEAVGSPTGNFRVGIYTHNISGEPGTMIGQSDLTPVSSITTNWTYVDMPSVAVSGSSTPYWVVVYYDNAGPTNYIKWQVTSNTDGYIRYYTEAGWQNPGTAWTPGYALYEE